MILEDVKNGQVHVTQITGTLQINNGLGIIQVAAADSALEVMRVLWMNFLDIRQFDGIDLALLQGINIYSANNGTLLTKIL